MFYPYQSTNKTGLNKEGMSKDSEKVIGYGSLILPTQVMRFDERVGSLRPLHRKSKRYGEKGLLREEAIEAWDEKKDRIDLIPVKINGIRRDYNMESIDGGTKLDARESENCWMNAVLITGLEEEEKKELDTSEVNYETKELTSDEIIPYLEKDNSSIPEEPLTIYMGQHGPTSRFRNQTYHDRIRTGAEMLADNYPEEVAEEFWQDFQETTYENTIPGINAGSYSEWAIWTNTVKENDRAREGFNYLMENY